jgi:murein tripeptide amidase MpaA
MTAVIDSCFDGGNIRRIDSDDQSLIRLEIEADAGGEFYQWFYFRITAARDSEFQVVIENAATSSYPAGWENYNVVVSNDQKNWYRIAATYDSGRLRFPVTLQSDVLWVAYFTPYSLQQHAELIGRISTVQNVRCLIPGHTVDGRSIDCLQIGNPNAAIKVWAIGRQHPGETMAQWWMEGYLKRLTDYNDAVVRELLKQVVFYVVPNMNPDGSYRGYLRTNAAGRNLNREWSDATPEHSPEVYYVRQKMHETGVDFCLDVHGDEAIPYNFIAGTEGIDSWNEQRQLLQDKFKSNLQSANPDFQTTVGYPVTPPGRANYAICSSYIAETFNCPAMTLEMPFKDTELSPDPLNGWSAVRSAKLGHSCIDAIYSIVDDL